MMNTRSLLCAFSFAALLSLAKALECDIDLGLIGDGGNAECEIGCEYCNFSLDYGTFKYSAAYCLPLVPCFVQVNTPESQSMEGAIIFGLDASALTVNTEGAPVPFLDADIVAPQNGGDFRFESFNTSIYPLALTKFHAPGSGVVDIIINDCTIGNLPPDVIEFACMEVHAGDADELNIVLRNGTQFAVFCDSWIQCPFAGKCTFQSDGARFDYEEDDMALVNVLILPSTDLRLICEDNSQSCDGVLVHCLETGHSCEMQYAGDWQCNGTLNAESQCYANIMQCVAADVSESSFGYSADGVPFDELSKKKTPFGWSLPLNVSYGDSLQLYTFGGAEHRCDGTVTVTREQVADGNEDDLFTITWKGNARLCVRFSEFHVYIGEEKYPMSKNGKKPSLAPGQFGCKASLDEAVEHYSLQCRSDVPVGEEFFMIIHAESVGQQPTDEGNAFCGDVVFP